MSDSVLIALIVAGALVVIVFLLRGRLSWLRVKANREGLETEVEARTGDARTGTDAKVVVRGNVQVGEGQRIGVSRGDVEVSANRQVGRGQEIEVDSGEG